MGEVVELRTFRPALTWGDEWRAHAEKMEMLYELAGIQRDMAEALLRDALAECERLRGLIK